MNYSSEKNPLQLTPSKNYDEVLANLKVRYEERRTKNADGSTVTKNTPIVENCGYNFLQILRHDKRFSDLRYNTVKGVPERFDERTGKRTPWTDADDADARLYIESVYGINAPAKYDDAINSYLQTVKYSPVQKLIESIKWDGHPHAEEFLIKWMGAEDNEVNRECSRLLFAGGIRRAYEPGSKFDYCIVLIGSQGGGKSTICRWLAMEDDLYTSLKTIQGQKGSEGIQGKWIVEIEELLAVLANDKTGSHMEEEAKAFLSRQSEFYRLPYAKRPTDNPRTNVFIGTTNRDEFLEDPTGNRRWYPVKCSGAGTDLYSKEAECREDIKQAWAEMLVAYRNHEPLANTYTSPELEEQIRARQRAAEVEDELVGMVQDYLDRNNKVETCIPEIFNNVLNAGGLYVKSCDKTLSRRLGYILTRKLGWSCIGSKRFPAPYGVQKGYSRLYEF